MRTYIVTFNSAVEAYKGKYARLEARSMEDAKYKAMERFGAMCVSQSHKDDDYTNRLMKLKGMEEI